MSREPWLHTGENGPATIATLLILHDRHRLGTIVLASLVNPLITLISFLNASTLVHWIGETALKVVSKVVAIFLAAIGIMMVRGGVESFLVSFMDGSKGG